jgi:hypothetical protein
MLDSTKIINQDTAWSNEKLIVESNFNYQYIFIFLLTIFRATTRTTYLW